MKKLSIRPLRILPLLLAATACAKYITPWEPREANREGDKLLEECQYRLENGRWVLERKTGYGYDNQGSLIRATLYEKPSGRPEVRKSWEFGYTPELVWSNVLEEGDAAPDGQPGPILGDVQAYRAGNGGIIRVTNEWDRGKLFGAQKNVVSLDAQGREVRRDYFAHADGMWIPESRLETRRDAAGRIVREDWHFLKTGETVSTVNEYDGQGRPLSITRTGQFQELSSYDGKGNLLSFESRQWRHGAWARTGRDEHAYDAQGRRIETLEERIAFGNGDGSPDSRSLRKCRFDRDSANLTETKVEWYLDGTTWNPVGKSFFRKNRHQDTLERIDSVWHEGAWRPQTKSLIEYDAERRQIGWLVYSYDAQRWTPYSLLRHAPVYNREGKVVSARFERWMSGNDSVTGEMTYVYDEWGYQTSSQIRERTAAGVEWGRWSTHQYLHPGSAGVASMGREKRRAGLRLAAGKIRGPEGRAFDVRGRTLRGLSDQK